MPCPRRSCEVSLSAPHRAALENLYRKKNGLAVDWINIADARALTELGLAVRSHQGWSITAAGEEAHSAQPEAKDDGDLPGRVVAYP
jgi:hypothetical protein